MARERPIYPFSALVGQERLKRALLLNAVNPRIGGVLIRGEKGTAKSTAVRGLARLLPPIDVVAGDPYNSSPSNPALMSEAVRARIEAGDELPAVTRATPLIELPVAASEDRVVGSLDLEHALTEGQRRFEPGLLAQANRGLLYVDEVNLLDDHVVDLLLDSAAMGINVVEREGGRTGIGNGVIGGDAVAKATADGYTLLFNASTFVTAPMTMKSVPYQVQRDFAPIGLVAQAPLSISVATKLGVADLKGLIATAKAQPGKLNFAVGSVGSAGHLCTVKLEQAAGISMLVAGLLTHQKVPQYAPRFCLAPYGGAAGAGVMAMGRF